MRIIADSGSTKSEWAILSPSRGDVTLKMLQGLNPYLQSIEQIETTIRQIADCQPDGIHFYGAGFGSSENRASLHIALKKIFPDVRYVEVETDIMGAARALCQRKEGIVGILGTGSNAAFYDGEQIVRQHGGYGFILGDEGSGGVMGKKLLQDFLNGKLPPSIRKNLVELYNLHEKTLLKRIYKEPFPNRYLASFAPFVRTHRKNPHIRKLLENHFKSYFQNTLYAFSDFKNKPFHLVGSVAWHFQDEIKGVAEKMNLRLGLIEKSPIEGLIQYHTS